jgi:hypothetical protein
VTIVRRNRTGVLSVVWFAVLCAIGLAYLTGLRLLEVTNLGAVLVMWYLPIALVIGAGAEELAAVVRKRAASWLPGLLAGLTAVAGMLTASPHVMVTEPYRFFVTPADVTAMGWIASHTPAGAVFAVNTNFWLPEAPMGTDGGYWIPYFTGRDTTAGPMIYNEGDRAYRDRVVELSRAAEDTAEDPSRVEALRELGVDYLYVGPKGDFSGTPLDPDAIASEAGVARVYDRDEVTILAIANNGSLGTARTRERVLHPPFRLPALLQPPR